MVMRRNIIFADEIKEILLADVVLVIAFSLTLSGGIAEFFLNSSTFAATFIGALPVAALAVTLSFILHELMHKFVAQHFGAVAGFKSSTMGLAVTLITGAFGFLLGIPGATMIYVQSFTKRENGLVSLAGPLTNFAIFFIFLGISFYLGYGLHPQNFIKSSYLAFAVYFTIFISILLAFFNMLPIAPLDGSKVLAWNLPIYVFTMGIIFILIVVFQILPISSIIYLILIALILSSFTRRVF